MQTLKAGEKWQKQALAFLVRCRAQMWGAHKEEPLSWLYRAGFSISFAQEHLFGWNFRPTKRKFEFEAEKEKSILIPEGLILPIIEEKKVLRLSVIGEKGESLYLEGSLLKPLLIEIKKDLIFVLEDIDLFYLLEKKPETFSYISAPDPLMIKEDMIKDFQNFYLIAERSKKAEKLLEQLKKLKKDTRILWLSQKNILKEIFAEKTFIDKLEIFLEKN